MDKDTKWRNVLNDLIDSAQDDAILTEILLNRFDDLTNLEKQKIVIGLIARIFHYQEKHDSVVQLR